MKKTIIFAFSLVFLALISCLKVAKDTPSCVKNHIKEFKDKIVCSDGKVDEYQFQSGNVYVFEPGTCGADMSSEVLDQDCNSLGFLGGITGNTMINGSDFNVNAVYIRTVWNQ